MRVNSIVIEDSNGRVSDWSKHEISKDIMWSDAAVYGI